MNVSPFLLHIWLQFDVRYISHLMSHAAHISRFVLCQLRALSNPAKLLFCIFMLNYWNHRIAVCIANMTIARSALYSTFATKNSAHQLVWDISALVLDKSSVMAVLHTQSKIFKSTYLRFNCTHVDHSMRIILHICCKTSRFVPCQLWTRSNSV